MKGISAILMCVVIGLTSSAHALSPKKQGYCKQHPDACRYAAAWCAAHKGKHNACKVSPEEYCPNHRAVCEQ